MPVSTRAARIETFILDASGPLDQWGFLRSRVPVTRTGVLLYRNEDGSTRREYRPPEEVFHADSLASLDGVPLVFEHPDGDGKVTPRNARRATVGYVSSPTADKAGGRVVAQVVVNDSAALDALRAGTHVELSCGYLCTRERAPGVTPEGEPYDVIQREIRYNHVAQTRKGRAGSAFALPRLDDEDAATIEIAIADPPPAPPAPGSGSPVVVRASDPVLVTPDPINSDSTSAEQVSHMALKKITLDGVEHEVPEAAAAAIEKMKVTLDSANERANRVPNEAEIEAKIVARVKARAALEGTARQHLGQDFAVDSLSDTEIQKAVVGKLAPGATLDSYSVDQIAMRFQVELDHARDVAGQTTAKKTAAADSRAQMRTDTAYRSTKPTTDAVEEARQRYLREEAERRRAPGPSATAARTHKA